MTDMAMTMAAVPTTAAKPKLDGGMGPASLVLFVGTLAAGALFTAWSIWRDVAESGAATTTLLSFVLLGVALVIALGFEFVNGFHDTANAVATVIYTHALPPNVAVMWSGFWNFAGVALSSGAVAIALGLPVSTTHVLSSGVAGTMAANKSGLQLATLRNLLIAWVLTLPVAILLSGSLYALVRQIF